MGNMGGAVTTGAGGTNNDAGAMATGGFGAGNGDGDGEVDGASAVGKPEGRPIGTDCCVAAFTGAASGAIEGGATAVVVDPVDKNETWNADTGCGNTGAAVLNTGKVGYAVDEYDA
jgi:hypothetical protein